ncbi:LysR family transcriptional regulator, partial [Salinivibrio sp. VYel4]
MDIRALRYFIALVEKQSFTAASASLHVTQPTISKMV